MRPKGEGRGQERVLAPRPFPAYPAPAMTDPVTIFADYSLHPSELASNQALLVEARQPAILWGAPMCSKSQIAQPVATNTGHEYIDFRALLLDPVDLRGIPWIDSADRTHWAPSAFLPPSLGSRSGCWRWSWRFSASSGHAWPGWMRRAAGLHLCTGTMPASRRIAEIPGVGVLSATAVVAAMCGSRRVQVRQEIAA